MDPLKAAWQAMPGGGHKNVQELHQMLKDGHHPALKKMRRQVLIETGAFALFLGVYYNMFDGHQRPLQVNLLLIAGVLLMIGHGVAGYIHSRRSISVENVQQALALRLRQLKVFAALSVLFRVLGTGCILAFFMYTVQFTLPVQATLGWIILILMVQFGLMVWMWSRRVRRLGAALQAMQE